MVNPEKTLVIVDDMPDMRLTIGALVRELYTGTTVLKAEDLVSAASVLAPVKDKTTVRLIVDGLEGEWVDVVSLAIEVGVPKENIIVFSSSPELQLEVESKGIQFELKPDSDQFEATIGKMGTTLRL